MPVASRTLFALPFLFVSLGIQAQVLDDFSEAQAEVVDSTPDGTPATSTLAITSPVGAPLPNRTISANLATGSNSARILVGSGVLSYSQDAGTTGTGQVSWTGTAADLTAGGFDTLELDIATNQDTTPLTVTLGSGATTASQNITATPGAGTFTLALGSFTGVDLTAVDTLTIDIDGSTLGTDIQINSVGLADVLPPGVDITKTSTVVNPDDCLSEGDILEYTVVVSNTGDGVLDEVVVNDPLPADVTLSSIAMVAADGSTNGTTINTGGVLTDTAVNFTIDDLPMAASVTVTFQVTIGMVAVNTLIENVATVTTATGVTTLPSATATNPILDCNFPPIPVPTMNQWSMILLGLGLLLMGWVAHRRGMLS